MIVRFLFALLVSGWPGPETAWAQTTVIITSLDGSEQGRVCTPVPDPLCISVSALHEDYSARVKLSIVLSGEEGSGAFVWPPAWDGLWSGDFIGSVFVHDLNLDGTPELILRQWTQHHAEVRVFGAVSPSEWREVVAFNISRSDQFGPAGGVWVSDQGGSAGGILFDNQGWGCWHWDAGQALLEAEFTDGDCVSGDRTDMLATDPLSIIGVAPSAIYRD